VRLAYRVEKNIGGLEVAVDDGRLGLVQERQPLGGADGDLEPRRPRQRREEILEEMVLEALPGHVLVHQHPVVVLVAEAHQLDQMRMAQHPEVHHLRL